MASPVFIAKPTSKKDHFIGKAAAFYKMFPHDYHLEVNKVVQLPDNSMLTLLNHIGQQAARNILIVAHFAGDGLSIRIEQTSNTQWYAQALLLWLGRLETVYDEVKRESDPEKWYEAVELAAAEYSMGTPDAAVETLSPRLRTTQWPRGFAADVERAKKLPPDEKQKAFEELVRRADRGVREQIARVRTDLRMSGATIDAYLSALRRVHSLELTGVDIRGCCLGGLRALMQILGMFLGAWWVRAPRELHFFGSAPIKILGGEHVFWGAVRQRVEAPPVETIARPRGFRWQRSNSNKTIVRIRHGISYYNPKGRPPDRDEVLLTVYEFVDFETTGPDERKAELIAEHIGVVEAFAREKFGDFAKGQRLQPNMQLPLQFTWTEPYHFPQEEAFGQQLATAGGRYSISGGKGHTLWGKKW